MGKRTPEFIAPRNESVGQGEEVSTSSPAALPPADAGLESIALQADQLQAADQAGAAPGAPAPEEPAGPTNAQIVAGILGTVRETVCALAGLESPQTTLSADKCDQLGAIWGACLDQYGVKLSDRMGKYGPLIAACMGSVTILAPVVIEARKEIATKDQAPRALPAPVPAAPPDQTPAANDGVRPYKPGVIRPAFGQ